MGWQTNQVIVAARSATRRLGLNRFIGGWLSSSGYEAAYLRRVTSLVKPGDCVWDVGANRGFYTARFSALVGPTGRVVAFEPSSRNRDRLAQRVTALQNVLIRPEALGARSGMERFAEGEDEAGATGRLVEPTSEERGVVVPVEPGDELIERGLVPPPTLLKIDVEGSEYDVLMGLRASLRAPALRAVCVEIHFALLEARGQRAAPAAIEDLLASAGFRVSWTDASHLIGQRPEGAAT